MPRARGTRPPARPFKRLADLAGAAVLALPLVVVAAVLLVLNPWLNPGPLFFRQPRMGRGGAPFLAWKLRTMRVAPAGVGRGPFDALETDRITPLGRWLRRTRLDELPQVLNVLAGDMSLIGPRPDYWPHAQAYARAMPRYLERTRVRPGISGLAQTEVGYAACRRSLRAKIACDLHYVRHPSWRMELWIAWRTLQVIAGRKGQ